MARTQGEFLDAAVVFADAFRARVGVSVYRLLADYAPRLFGDECFADLFEDSAKSRPSVPARVVAAVMLLQSLESLSDREAIDRLRFDLRGQTAAGLNVVGEGFHPTGCVRCATGCALATARDGCFQSATWGLSVSNPWGLSASERSYRPRCRLPVGVRPGL